MTDSGIIAQPPKDLDERLKVLEEVVYLQVNAMPVKVKERIEELQESVKILSDRTLQYEKKLEQAKKEFKDEIFKVVILKKKYGHVIETPNNGDDK